MRILVTCGPSYEPIDEVRRITNFSTGELGIRLANRLARDGHAVTCFRGVAATRALTLDGPAHVPFSTNDDLLAKLTAVADREHIGAVFHAAALADFRVERSGMEKKISSRAGALTLTLVPATKLIAQLRPLFPRAWIVGWKYELDGTRDEVLAKAQRQLAENATDLCIMNGAAYGDGFGCLPRGGPVTHLADRAALADYLAAQIARA
jgi:phosphopantothenoylcysteine synthetase/decarboxylase